MIIDVNVAILSAGEGKRLSLNVPKPLAPLGGRVLIDYVIDNLKRFEAQNDIKLKMGFVVGHQKEMVVKHIQSSHPELDKSFMNQEKQLGTADAIKSYFNGASWTHSGEYTVIMCADTPLISEKYLTPLYKIITDQKLDGVVASFSTHNPFGYGRIIRDKDIGLKIIEEKDLDSNQKKINEVNSGLYVFKTSFLLENIFNISSSNAANEFYLTDMFQNDFNVKAVLFDDREQFIGVNTLDDLESVESSVQSIKIADLKKNGVRFIDSKSNYIESDVEIGKGSVVYKNAEFYGKSKIGDFCTIKTGSIIENTIIEDNCIIKPYSHLESSLIKKSSEIGPFAHLRPGSDIGEGSKVGNFVEIKKSQLDKGVKVSHLSYVGDAKIGESVNIGCGFITCNYDGANKNKTIIGKNSFIGSDSQTIAPVSIGEGCYVASGSTINKDMKDGDFAISRMRQTTKEGLAKKFIKIKK